MRKLFWLLGVLASALIAAPSWAQDDNPYGEPAARPTAPPAGRPPGPPAGARPGQPAGQPPAHTAPAPVSPPPAAPPEPVHAPQPPHALPEEPASALPSPSPAEPNHAAAGSPEPLPAGHDVPGHGEHGAGTEHGGPGHLASAGGEHGGHGAAHEDHNAPPHAMNWFYGFLGTDDKVEPNLLWRKPDMPPPFLANLINFALFAYVIVRFGKKPLQEALTSRKKAIMQDIDAATKMLDDATKRLNQYEDKLRHIDQEIERIKKDFREQGERDKERILAEAKDKRERMLKDAQFLIEQEAKQLRIDLIRETVDAAVQAAEQILVQKITSADHDRIAEDYLKQLASSRGLGVSKGGSA